MSDLLQAFWHLFKICNYLWKFSFAFSKTSIVPISVKILAIRLLQVIELPKENEISNLKTLDIIDLTKSLLPSHFCLYLQLPLHLSQGPDLKKISLHPLGSHQRSDNHRGGSAPSEGLTLDILPRWSPAQLFLLCC
jgi:hypothetical protein